MDTRCTPSKIFAGLAYVLSAAGTFLWVGCVLPSGTLAAASSPDAATPVFRMGNVLVPALLLIVLLPAAAALSRRERGLRSLLAATDAFVAAYACTIIWLDRPVHGTGSIIACGLLLLLAVVSAWEAIRNVRAHKGPLRPSFLRGIRLCIALMVLMAPSQVFVREGGQSGEFLIPFVLLAVSAGGAQLARSCAGMRRAVAVLLIALATLQLGLLHHALHHAEPHIEALGPFGKATWILSLTVLGLSVVLFATSFHGETEPSEVTGDASVVPG